MNQKILQYNQNDPTFTEFNNLQSTVIQPSSNINVFPSFYTNTNNSDQQPTPNECIASTLTTPLSYAPQYVNPQHPIGPQQSIESLPLNMINPSQSEILSFDIPGFKIVIVPIFSIMNQNRLQNDPTFNLQSTAENASTNINNYADSSNSISSTFYTNHYSDQQPIYNENITSTLPPCVPGPQQQTIENTTFPLNSFNMNNINPSQSEILSFDIPGYKIIFIPTFSQQDNTHLNYSSSDTQFTQFQQ